MSASFDVLPASQPVKHSIDPKNELAKRLANILDASRILSRPIDRIAFASDGSLYRLIPSVVVQPATRDEVRKLFHFSQCENVPLTFRAGGTSLSGQAITDGILVDVGRHWRSGIVEEKGAGIRVQPGLIGQDANNLLKIYKAKIGPDPASISAARLGGMLSNNASGMCCGVEQNSYHTLRSMTFILPSGTEIDTAAPGADSRFAQLEPTLYNGLLELKQRIQSNPELTERIRFKYKMKNTTGYGLNAFLDYSKPVEIFSHLLIGAEGTLAFIAEAMMNTVPDLPVKYTGLLIFPDLHAACAAIEPLRAAGAAALELMDRASLRSVEDQPGIPKEIIGLPEQAAALLAEFQTADVSDARENAARAEAAIAGLNLLLPAQFTDDEAKQSSMWRIRKGLFPSVGAVRAKGTTALIEDVAFPLPLLADAAVDLTKLFAKHGYTNAIIFGHAKDGNLHFVITPGFNTWREVEQYRNFIDDVVELVVHKYDGALKAEHGTGRNMAPFVQTEWGAEAYAIMMELKALADPHGLLNPGVILNTDPAVHIANLKTMPVIESIVDKCIECGYCEPMCPSRDLTLTPRQRIVVRRELTRLKDAAKTVEYDALDKDFPYMALETCAVDGLCATGCPVGIDTGKLIKIFRQLRHSNFANEVAASMAAHWDIVEFGGRIAMRAGHLVQSVFGLGMMQWITGTLDRTTRALMDEPFWKWSAEMPFHRKGVVPSRPSAGAEAVYFPACISRIMGALPGEPDEINIMQAMLRCADRAGVKLYVPEDVKGHCCGVPFSSKGFDEAHRIAIEKTIQSFYRWSCGGALPILVDTSPCTHGIKTARPYLSPDAQAKFDKLTILDSVEFVHDRLLASLTIKRKVHSAALHPVCSAVKMAITPKLRAIAAACSENLLLPAEAGCCGFAGDRGFLVPELTASATTREAAEVSQNDYEGYYSSSRTCEIGMTRATGKVYRSYLFLVEYATRE